MAFATALPIAHSTTSLATTSMMASSVRRRPFFRTPSRPCRGVRTTTGIPSTIKGCNGETSTSISKVKLGDVEPRPFVDGAVGNAVKPRRANLLRQILGEAITDDELQEFLIACKNARKMSLSPTLDAVLFDVDTSGLGVTLVPNVLYVPKEFHELLTEIRCRYRVVMMGNPGTCKSVFQYYVLLRIFNPDLYGPLPPDIFGNTTPPSFIIRQVETKFELYDVECSKAAIVPRNTELLKCFDKRKAIFIFEPGNLLEEPCIRNHFLITWMSASPAECRYKEFVKSGALMLYMPRRSLAELLGIIEHMRQQESFPKAWLDIECYQPQEVERRFMSYGGILRHCIPQNPEVEGMVEKKRIREIQKCEAEALLSEDTLEDSEVSHLIAQYVVCKDGRPGERYRDAYLDIVSEEVAVALREEISRVSLAEKIRALRRFDKVPYGEEMYDHAKIYEHVVASQLCKGVGWRKRRLRCLDWDLEPFHTHVTRMVPGVPESGFFGMKDSVLYFPFELTYPLGDMFIKKDGKLIILQVTKKKEKKRVVRKGPLEEFLDKMCLDRLAVIDFYLVPRPVNAANATVQMTEESLAHVRDEHGNTNFKLFVLEVPSDYGLRSEGFPVEM